jgi:glycosyltransferase involved in cell wall biosynthesis
MRTVSIVLPVRNEGKAIRETLGAVLDQSYPSELTEIIVADGMSEDDTREIVRELQLEHPNLKLIDNPGRIVSTGMNAAIRESTGDVIVRVDGHTVIDPNYVHMCVKELEASGAQNVGGRMIGVGRSSFGKAVMLATSSPFGVGGARFHYSDKREWVDTVYLGAWRRETLDEIGLFDEKLVRNQDDELNYRLLDHGGRILLSPNIISRYTVRATPTALFRQYHQYGYWKVQVMQKHPRQVRLRQLTPPTFTSALGVLSLLSLGSRKARKLLKYLALVYTLGCTLAAFNVPRKNGHVPVWLVAAVFPILHIAYGTGFIRGLWCHPHPSKPSRSHR